MLRLSKFLIGIILIPLVIAITLAFFETLTNLEGFKGGGSKIFLWGALAYAILHLFIFRPAHVYTFGHEMTHVLTTWLSGGGVRSFKTSGQGGQVETTKSNVLINLGPYCIPTYTLIASFLYFILPLFIKIPNLKTIYFFAAGFTLTLHLIFTAEALKIKQPDIIKTGYLFSLVIIYIINIVLVTFLVSLLFEGVSFESFFYGAYSNAKNIYAGAVNQLFFFETQ